MAILDFLIGFSGILLFINLLILLYILYKWNELFLIILPLPGGVLCVQAEDEINLQEVVDKLPEDLVGKLNISALPSTEEAEKLAREKCRKESGSDDAYDKAFVSIIFKFSVG